MRLPVRSYSAARRIDSQSYPENNKDHVIQPLSSDPAFPVGSRNSEYPTRPRRLSECGCRHLFRRPSQCQATVATRRAPKTLDCSPLNWRSSCLWQAADALNEHPPKELPQNCRVGIPWHTAVAACQLVVSVLHGLVLCPKSRCTGRLRDLTVTRHQSGTARRGSP